LCCRRPLTYIRGGRYKKKARDTGTRRGFSKNVLRIATVPKRRVWVKKKSDRGGKECTEVELWREKRSGKKEGDRLKIERRKGILP